MLTPDEIRRFASNRYHEFLRTLISGTSIFPLELKRFGRAKTAAGVRTVRDEIEALIAGAKEGNRPGYCVDFREVQSVNLGSRQRLPERVYFDSEGDFIGFIGKQAEVECFRRNLEATKRRCPNLVGWIAGNLARFLRHATEWADLLSVCEYFARNPAPQLYARELPIAVHTKFVEEHISILDSLLSHLLRESMNLEAGDFYGRFSLRDTEPFIEIRILDENLSRERSFPLRHLKVPQNELRELPFANVNAVIVENRLPLLTLPAFPRTVALFGQGDAVSLLKTANWLASCPCLYWGDIDARGFDILSRCRTFLPAVQSILMDRSTFDHFVDFQVDYDPGTTAPPNSLTSDENAMRGISVSTKRRLEQERLGLDFAHAAIERAIHAKVIRGANGPQIHSSG